MRRAVLMALLIFTIVAAMTNAAPAGYFIRRAIQEQLYKKAQYIQNVTVPEEAFLNG